MKEIYTSLQSVECEYSELKKDILLAACDSAASCELVPDDSHKSFYGKAKVKSFDKTFVTWGDDVHITGDVLFSYNTAIIAKVTINSEYSAIVPLYFGGYHSHMCLFGMGDVFKWDVSSTTLRHIKAYCGLNKSQYYKLALDFWDSYFNNVGVPYFGEQFTVTKDDVSMWNELA